MNRMNNWIERKFRRQGWVSCLLSPMALALGLVVMFLTFWLFYALVFIMALGVSSAVTLFTGRDAMLTHNWRLVASGLWLPWVIVGYWRNPLEDLAPMPRANYVNAGYLVYRGGAAASFAVMLAYPQATGLLLRDLFSTGPKLVHGGIWLWRQGRGMLGIDTVLCATILEYLEREPDAVPYEELESFVSHPDFERACHQLHAIDGVVFLEKGLGLTSDLREELRPLIDGVDGADTAPDRVERDSC